MRARSWIPLALLLVHAAQTASADAAPKPGAVLRGIVTDSATGDGLFSANAILSRPNGDTVVGRLTGEKGDFFFENLAAGLYRLKVSYMGYRTKTIEITVRKNKPQEISITLDEAAFEVDAVQVTASRRPEKILEAPASVQVVGKEAIRAVKSMTPADNITALPAVDVVRSGLNQANVVVRGFNNVFSGATLTLVDNRIARVPSLRVNAYQFIPTATDDLDRIEIVSGPGSALYGPNSANGVIHMLTRSPFDSPGTEVSASGGERGVTMGSVRHAMKLGENVAYKVTVQQQQGNDWQFTDRLEAEARENAIALGALADTLSIGRRDYDIDRLGVEGRLDVRMNGKSSLILGGGYNRASNVEMTGVGGAQIVDHTYSYLQGRLLYGGWFLQSFVNMSDAGDSYLLRTGEGMIDESKLIVTQLQHGMDLGENQDFTYGMDVLLTRPETKGTILGRNEDDDNIDEVGGYFQSETRLSNALKLVAAARLDHHNRLEGVVFSPRAAIVYGKSDQRKFRLTYNRAYSTPSSTELFVDVIAMNDVFGFSDFGMNSFQSDVLYRGVPDEGYTFRKDANGGLGGLYMQSPFNPLGREAYAPADANVAATSLEASWAWLNARTLVAAQGYPQVLAVSSPGPGDVATTLRVVDIATETLVEVDPSYVMDIDPLIPTIRNTAEVGFKGFLSQTLGASVDVYHNRVNNFVSAVRVETPNVFLDSTSVHAYLLSEGVPEADVAELASKLAEIPLGTITPEGFTGDDAADLMISYRNFGDFSYMGVDMSLLWAPSRLWTGGLNYSYVSRDFFRSADGIGDVALNAPKHKFGGMVAYSDRATGFNAMLRVRYVDAFPVDSGAYTGTIQAYTIADLSASYDFTEATRLNLTIQNILDHRHQEFIGAPELGRLALLGLSQSF